MDELSAILGEDLLGDAIECCLGDDAAPTLSEAQAQTRAVLAKQKRLAAQAYKRKRANWRKLVRYNPELGKISFGRVLKAGLTGGVSELAKTRVGRAIATGGVSEAVRAGKKLIGGKPAVKVAAKASGALKAGASIGGALKAAAGLGARVAGPSLPEIKIRCIPCSGDAATAADVARKIQPEMARVRKLLDKMALQAKATSEHNNRKRQRKWRKQVIGLLTQVREKRCHA